MWKGELDELSPPNGGTLTQTFETTENVSIHSSSQPNIFNVARVFQWVADTTHCGV